MEADVAAAMPLNSPAAVVEVVDTSAAVAVQAAVVVRTAAVVAAPATRPAPALPIHRDLVKLLRIRVMVTGPRLRVTEVQ